MAPNITRELTKVIDIDIKDRTPKTKWKKKKKKIISDEGGKLCQRVFYKKLHQILRFWYKSDFYSNKRSNHNL